MITTKKMISKIICPHKSADLVITINHEICCKRCGVLLGIDNTQEVSSESTANLFQEVQPGCKPVKIESTIRIHDTKFLSSSFSNACDKLNLPKYVSLDAYNLFVKLERINYVHKQTLKENINKTQSNYININFQKSKIPISDKICRIKKERLHLTNGKIAMYSLFIAIRRFGILRSSNEIRNAVKLSFSIKQLPHMLKVFSEIKPITTQLGLELDDESHLEYWINIYLRNVQEKISFLTSDVKNKVRKTAQTLSGSDEAKARLAVKIVLIGLGVKNV